MIMEIYNVGKIGRARLANSRESDLDIRGTTPKEK